MDPATQDLLFPKSGEAPVRPPQHPIFARKFDERLGLPYPARQLISGVGGGFIGVFLGLSQGSKVAALRFRAENAHRQPTSHKGWYLYHKSKNYVAMWSGLKEGGRMGLKVGFWSGLFVCVEETVDNWRNDTKDALSTVIAGMACAGAWSAWNRFNLITAARVTRVSFVGSLAFGLGQDALGVLRGRDVSYVSFIKRKVWGQDTEKAT